MYMPSIIPLALYLYFPFIHLNKILRFYWLQKLQHNNCVVVIQDESLHQHHQMFLILYKANMLMYMIKETKKT